MHARDAIFYGAKNIIIKANDTDVVVIALSVFPSLQEFGLQKMWVFHGRGLTADWMPVHDLVSAMTPAKSIGILYFHAFTGCDVVSAFKGKGKKSAWLAWEMFNEITETFVKLSKRTDEVSDSDLQNLERFVITMYDENKRCYKHQYSKV